MKVCFPTRMVPQQICSLKVSSASSEILWVAYWDLPAWLCWRFICDNGPFLLELRVKACKGQWTAFLQFKEV